MGDEEFLRRLGVIYSDLHVAEVKHQLALRREAGDDEGAERFKQEKYLYRMWDLSQFMKVLKQRFTQWFNKRHGRKGTLWEDRFKSVLVEDGYTALVMSAYIDLNPVSIICLGNSRGEIVVSRVRRADSNGSRTRSSAPLALYITCPYLPVIYPAVPIYPAHCISCSHVQAFRQPAIVHQ